MRLIRMRPIPVLVWVKDDGILCSKAQFKGLEPINEVKKVLIHVIFNIVHHYQLFANYCK